MKKFKRGFWAKIVVAIATIVATIGIIGGTSYASNNQPFLGDCIEYGVVCNFINQTSDMETNFAAIKYQGNGHCIGNSISDKMANASGVIKVGEIVGEIKVRNNPVIIKGEDVTKEVKAMIASVANYSESVVDKKDIDTKIFAECQRYSKI